MFKLLRFISPLIIFSIILVTIQSLAEIELPTIMTEIVNAATAGKSSEILNIGMRMMAYVAVMIIAMIGSTFFSSLIGTKFSRDVRAAQFKNVETLSLNEFNIFGTASLITRNSQDVTQIQNFLVMGVRMLISTPIMFIGGTIKAADFNNGLEIVLWVSIPVLILVIAVVGIYTMPIFKKIQLKADRLIMRIRENLTGIRVIRAFNKQNYETQKFDAANSDITKDAIKVSTLMSIVFPVLMLLMQLTTVAALYLAVGMLGGSQEIGLGNIEAFSTKVSSIMAIVTYIMMIMMNLLMATFLFIMYPRASACAVRVNEVLKATSSVKDPVNPLLLNNVRGEVEFRNASFIFPGAETATLANISFVSKPGQVTAIVGSTGSGKSSIVNLLPRFYDVSSGEIFIDGINIMHVSQNELRNNIGYVSQKAVLFDGTVEENIKVGKADATFEEVVEAAKIAQADDYIVKLDNGYNYHVSGNATNLSGGQKQRLSIARAIVKRPKIYIFDDSFSALDFKTDAKLRAALNDNLKEATIFIVAQRVSSILHADQILVLEEGKLVGKGTHKELLSSCPTYKEIVSSQLEEEEM